MKSTKNEQNSPTKKNIIFDDNLSDLSKSLIEENEEERKGLELEQFVNDDYIEKLKDLIKMISIKFYQTISKN